MAGSALVVGDGIAGLGAAIVLARAGWVVHCAGTRTGKSAHHRRHAHLTSAAVVAKLEGVAGGLLGGWATGAALVWDANGRRDETPRPIVSAEALREGLARRAEASGAHWQHNLVVEPSANAAVWQWSAGTGTGTADLLVDATGSGHWLGRMRGVDVTIEELAGTDRCWSWTGLNDGPPQPWLLAARAPETSAALLRGPDGQLRLTLRQPGGAMPDPAAALDRLLLGAKAAWAARIGTIALDPRPLRHDSPLARRTLVSDPASLPPLVRIGDGLIQTAPRLGQGIAQIAEQLDALATAAAESRPLRQWQASLGALAERRWSGLVLGAGLGRIAA